MESNESKIKTGYEIPEPSTSFYSEVRLMKRGGTLTLYFDYDKNGELFRSGLRFKRVRAMRHWAESYCTAWHVKGAYDNLVVVDNSAWLQDLENISLSRGYGPWNVRHYMIYMDSAGCYEFIAENWEALPEEKGALEN